MKRHRTISFHAVIHCTGPKQAAAMATIAFNHGADGVFLIGHGIEAPELLNCIEEVRQDWPNDWIGANFLELDTVEALDAMPDHLNGIWFDGLFTTPTTAMEELCTQRIHRDRCQYQPFLTFMGVNFKHQEEDDDRQIAIKSVLFDVLTTSGPATGQPATVSKVSTLKRSITKPLALASGVNIDNIDSFLPLVDHFLIGTGISKDFHTLDAKKVRLIASRIWDYTHS